MLCNVYDYPVLGKGRFTRKYWVNNWRMYVMWTEYIDYCMIDVVDDITAYCDQHGLPYGYDHCEFTCVCNRKQYNDIHRIIDMFYWL